MITTLADPRAARAWCAEQRAEGTSLGLVPTMGALHEGHLELVRRATAENDAACVSVFVNPLQFDNPEDLSRYPRDYERDVELLDGVGCAMVFTGTLEGFFEGELTPDGRLLGSALREPGPCAAGLEGEHRPGHFGGVATIVARLFEVARPERAYFGQKDFQQALVVGDLARRMGYPEVVVCPTVRQLSGLALPSRNALLSPADEQRATCLVRALRAADAAWWAGEREPSVLAKLMRGVLEEAGARVEYAELRDPTRWSAAEPVHALELAIALVAAFVGDVRLIDNLELGCGLVFGNGDPGARD